MKKARLISALLVLFASCQNSWRGVTDGDFDDFGGGDPVPVLVGVGNSGLPYTRGSGAVDDADGRQWADVNIYVYAFNRDGSSFASTAVSGNGCLIDASVDNSRWTAGRKAYYDGSDGYLTWADSDKEVYYPNGREIYDFYAYYIDNLNIPQTAVQRSKDKITLPVTIDGSMDLMTGKAPLKDDVFKGTLYSETEKSLIRKYAFSSYTARRNINPRLEFVHHLTRLRFEIYPASDGSNTVMVNSITVKSKTSGTFTVVSRDESKLGVDFSSDKNYRELILRERDGSALKQDTYHTDYQGDFTDVLYERPHVQVGGSLLVAPDTEYEVNMEMKEVKGQTYHTKSSFSIRSASGFQAGSQYVVRLSIYGMMDIRPNVEVEPWGTGGSIILDEEDKLK